LAIDLANASLTAGLEINFWASRTCKDICPDTTTASITSASPVEGAVVEMSPVVLSNTSREVLAPRKLLEAVVSATWEVVAGAVTKAVVAVSGVVIPAT